MGNIEIVCAEWPKEVLEAKDGSFWKNTSLWKNFLRYLNKNGLDQIGIPLLETLQQRLAELFAEMV